MDSDSEHESSDTTSEEDNGLEVTSVTLRKYIEDMIKELQPVDSSDPDGGPVIMPRDRHGCMMLKIMERKIREIGKKIQDQHYRDAYEMIVGLIIAIKIQDHWIGTDDGDRITRVCSRIGKLFNKVVTKYAVNEKDNISDLEKEEFKKHIEYVADFGEDLEQYGIETLTFNKDKLIDLF